MTLFIIVILAAALIESMLRLSLVPRFWNWLVFLLAAPLPLFFRQRIGSASLAELNRFLSSAENLESWCALVVIQELLVLLIGSALIVVAKIPPFWGDIPVIGTFGFCVAGLLSIIVLLDDYRKRKLFLRDRLRRKRREEEERWRR